ncbi:OmpA family protein [Vibrio sp. LaRot3]|uniref:OmpA family protein n=1 Tax=Vibrio sp. LaRot3 TaxID=2998829 RepID=UPI0022CDED76|nr:OmpA family protein [Vibrio sp. LaRot3]MDA0149314.1 OmpA family protein [Vibrio sp. LaRot3]
MLRLSISKNIYFIYVLQIIPLISTPFFVYGGSLDFHENESNYFEGYSASPYFGLSVYYSDLEDDSFGYTEPTGIGKSLIAGVMFGKNINFDFTYSFDSEYVASESSVDINVSSFETGVQYDLFLSEKFYVFGRVGAAYWKVNKSSISSSDNIKSDLRASGVSPVIGLGSGYELSPEISIFTGYKYFNDIGSNITGSYDEHRLFVGGKYFFLNSRYDKKTEYVNEVEIVIDEGVSEDSDKFVFMTFDSTNFSVNSSKISSYGRYKLIELVGFLNENPSYMIDIVGHSDSTGTKLYNEKLSLERAVSVFDLLVLNGISPDRMMVFGEGESSPKASNLTTVGRAENRRVEVVIKKTAFR